MAIATTSTLANVLREVYQPILADIAFENNALIDLQSLIEQSIALGAFPEERGGATREARGLFPVRRSRGDTYWRFPVRYSRTAAAAYSEGQAAPAPGNNTYLMAKWQYSVGYFWRSVEITGHAIDALRDEGAIVEAVDREVRDAARAIGDLINTTFLGTGTNCLQAIVDSGGTVGGIDRSTYTAWGSWENALGGALSESALRDMVEAVLDNDRGANYETLAFLMPVNQITNYHALAGASSSVPKPAEGGRGLDLGHIPSLASFGGIPMYGIPDLTDTVVMLVDVPGFYWVLHRPLQFEQKPTAGDSYQWLITCSIILVSETPHLCAKQTGVTA